MPPTRHGFTAPRAAARIWSVERLFPDHERLGYSRDEAYRLVRMAEVLWNRYTALGLTIDSPDSPLTALLPFEVLVQAVWQAGMLELFNDATLRKWSKAARAIAESKSDRAAE